MREIKFRYTVIRAAGHTFKRVFTLLEIERGDVEHWLKINNVDDRTLFREQFTGLKDMNGIDIYEGDHVLFHSANNANDNGPFTVRFGGQWEYAGFGITRKRLEGENTTGDPRHDYSWDTLNPRYAKDIEVISHIFS